MLKVNNLVLTTVLTFGLVACGAEGDVSNEAGNGDTATTQETDGTSSTDDTTSTGGSTDTTTAPVAEIPFTCPNSAITEGLNTNWQAGGQARQFYAYLPNVDANTPISVIYVSHGVGDTAANFKNFVGAQPDADPDFPYAMIVPQGLQLQPIAMGGGVAGIEWDIFESISGDDNLEAALFESVLGCIAEQYTVDASRVYTWGFSGGAILSAMLTSRYPEMIGASYIMSGAWFNDRDTVDNIDTGFLTIPFAWDALNPEHEGTVLMTHGGENDNYGDPQFAMGGVGNNGRIMSFEDSAYWAHTHLQNNNRNVIDCAHQNGHTNHPGISNAAVYDFFKNHRAGKATTYTADGLPSGLANLCTLNP